MGLFKQLKKLRLKDIGTGKNLKKIGKGIKRMKFGEGLGLLGLGLGGAGLFGAGPLGNTLGGIGSKLGNLAFGKGVGTDAITGKVIREGTGMLNNPMVSKLLKKGGKSLLNLGMKNYANQGQPTIPTAISGMPEVPLNVPPGYGQMYSSNYQPNPMYGPQQPVPGQSIPQVDTTEQVIDTQYGGGWTGV